MRLLYLLCFFFVFGCAGIERSCSSSCATELGADWIVVQYTFDGEILQCWELNDTSIANEESSDGIYWLSEDGHLVHISNLYNRVQVENGAWGTAYAELNMTRDECTGDRDEPGE